MAKRQQTFKRAARKRKAKQRARDARRLQGSQAAPAKGTRAEKSDERER
jgi:hypothetical protein